MSFRDLARDWHADQATGHALARALVQQAGWWLPATLTEAGPAPFMLSREDGPWLVAFSSQEDLTAWAEEHEAGELSLQLTGPGLVEMLTDDLAGLDLEAGTPEAVHYRSEQFGVLELWAQAVAVESILRGNDLPDPWTRVRDYPAYQLLVRQGGSSMVLAPDDQGRRLAAVCTAPDTLAAFKARIQRELGEEVQARVLAGRPLFELLSRLPLDGIVFNPSGPVPPAALAPAICQLVLGA